MEHILELIKKHGLFIAPLNNGDWMVGKSNVIYNLDIQTDHYKDKRLSIHSSLSKAVGNWIKQN